MSSIDSGLAQNLNSLNIRGLTMDHVGEIVRIRSQAIENQETVYQRRIADSMKLTVLPGRFSVLSFGDYLGSGTVKRVERVIRISQTGEVQLKAQATASGLSVGAPGGEMAHVAGQQRYSFATLKKEYDAAQLIHSNHVVSGMELYEITLTRKELIKRWVLFFLFALLIAGGLLLVTHAPPVAAIIGWVLFSSGVGGEVYLFMSCVLGKKKEHLLQDLYECNLEDYCKRPLPENVRNRQVANILIGAAIGLRDIHKKGLIHGDLKKENVFVQRISENECTGVLGDLELLQPATQRRINHEIGQFQQMMRAVSQDVQCDRLRTLARGNLDQMIEKLTKYMGELSASESFAAI